MHSWYGVHIQHPVYPPLLYCAAVVSPGGYLRCCLYLGSLQLKFETLKLSRITGREPGCFCSLSILWSARPEVGVYWRHGPEQRRKTPTVNKTVHSLWKYCLNEGRFFFPQHRNICTPIFVNVEADSASPRLPCQLHVPDVSRHFCSWCSHCQDFLMA